MDSVFDEEHIGPFEYEGIVITGTLKLDDGMTNFVLLMNGPESTDCRGVEVYGVHESAFVFNIQEDIEKYAAFKNVVRRTAEPLSFGTIVKWNKKCCDLDRKIINKFVREKSVYSVRSSTNCHEIRIGGVMSPDQSQFWNRLCPVNIPRTEALQAEPNVWIKSWIGVFVNGSNTENVKVNFEFMQFDDFDVTEQHRILEAPWLRLTNLPKYMLQAEPVPADDDYDIGVERNIKCLRDLSEWRETIEYQLGIFVGNHLIISRYMPQYDFIVPIKNPFEHFSKGKFVYPAVGEYVRFCASWSTVHRGFLVTEIDREHEFKNLRQSSSGNIKLSVKVSIEHPSLFVDAINTLGLIDDPGYHLALWTYYVAYHPNLEAKVEVIPVRAANNKSVRYRIVKRDSSNSTMSSFENWLQTADFSLDNVFGTAISGDTFISPQHPNLLFKWGALGEIKAGMNCQFKAVYRSGHGNEFLIENPTLCPGNSSISNTSKVFTHENALAKNTVIRLRMTKDDEFEQLAHSDVFGEIDTRGKNIKDKEFIAWVTESPKIKGVRRASTVLEVFSTDIGVPVGFPAASRNKDIQSGSSGSAASSTHSSGKRCFAGPTIRNINSRASANTTANISSNA